MRAIVRDAVDDGLIQRLFPIVLRPATVGKDEPVPDVAREYDALVERLHSLQPPGLREPQALRFDDRAQLIRGELEERHLALMQSETINRKFAAHVGKYDGLFGRLCVLWHCIENAGSPGLPRTVTANTAARVGEFLHSFLLRHAVAFYGGVLGLSDDHERLMDVAGYILTHKLEVMSIRELQRGSRSMRSLTRDEGRKIFEQLEAFGWLEEAPAPRSDAPRWAVVPAVHHIFAKRADIERRQREATRRIISDLAGQGG